MEGHHPDWLWSTRATVHYAPTGPTITTTQVRMKRMPPSIPARNALSVNLLSSRQANKKIPAA